MPAAVWGAGTTLRGRAKLRAAALPRAPEQMCRLIFKLKSGTLANKQDRRENTCPE